MVTVAGRTPYDLNRLSKYQSSKEPGQLLWPQTWYHLEIFNKQTATLRYFRLEAVASFRLLARDLKQICWKGWRGDGGKGIRPNSTRVEETKLIHQSIWRSKTVTLLLPITVRTDGESVLALELVAQFPVSAAYFTTATRVAPTLATLIPSYPPPRPIRVLCCVKTSINVGSAGNCDTRKRERRKARNSKQRALVTTGEMCEGVSGPNLRRATEI